MKLAIISKLNSPNTLDLVQAAEKRGMSCRVYLLRDLAFATDDLLASGFFSHDVYMFRGYNNNPEFAQALAYALTKQGKVVIEGRLVGGSALTKFQEALAYRHAHIPHVPTYVAGDVDAWETLDPDLEFPVVIKDVVSQKGKGVRLCKDKQSLLAEIKQHGFDILVQKYVALDYEIRVLCVGDKVVGAVKYESPEGQLRDDSVADRAVSTYALSAKESELALSAHKCIGHEISGIDMAYDPSGQPFIIETNITPEWQDIKQATSVDVAGAIIEYAKAKVTLEGIAK